MTDLDLLVAGAVVSFLSVAGAYFAIRRRANDSPVPAYHEQQVTNAQPAYPASAPGAQSATTR